MLRILLALAVFASTAWSAAPAYSAANIVNAGSYTPGPFAPGSVLSLFGTAIATSPRGITSDDIRGGQLPVELNSVRIYLNNAELPLFYVSETQINFMIPHKQTTGNATVRVARQGLSGPEVTIAIVDAAPALFVDDAGYAIVTHGDTTVITPGSPARGGETIVIYATGLGKLEKNPDTGQIPQYVSSIVKLPELKITVGGNPIDPAQILYAGLTPESAGLYQINVVLPAVLGNDPELRIAIGAISTPAGVKLAAR